MPAAATIELFTTVSRKAEVSVWSAFVRSPAPRLRAMSEPAPVPTMFESAIMTIITG